MRWYRLSNGLELGCEPALADLREFRRVPGKSDRADSEWLPAAAASAVAGQFVSPYQNYGTCDRRRIAWCEGTRRLASAWLEVSKDANIILRSVDRDTLGITGAVCAGAAAAQKAALKEVLERKSGVPPAPGGAVDESVVRLDEHATKLSSEIDQRMQDIQSVTKLLRSVPGMDRTIACVLIGEKVAGMSRFHHSLHLA